MGRVLVVTGTGTAIGKTHVARELVSLACLRGTACGFKPVETGVMGDGTDAAALRAVSSFHVKHLLGAPFAFTEGLSPHLAARVEGRVIALPTICEAVSALKGAVDFLVVELAGGLFTPLGQTLSNLDLVLALAPDRVLLVAPDRLGVLHDLGATTRAARGAGCRLDAIVLNAPASPDASTGRNASEVVTVTSVPVIGVLPWSAGSGAASATILSVLLNFTD